MAMLGMVLVVGAAVLFWMFKKAWKKRSGKKEQKG